MTRPTQGLEGVSETAIRGYRQFGLHEISILGRTASSLEKQALGPIHNPVEMGETLENVVRKLNAIPGYKREFQDVFHSDVTTDGIAKAIAAFERTIVSGPSRMIGSSKATKKRSALKHSVEWRFSTAKEHALPAIAGHYSRIKPSTT